MKDQYLTYIDFIYNIWVCKYLFIYTKHVTWKTPELTRRLHRYESNAIWTTQIGY